MLLTSPEQVLDRRSVKAELMVDLFFEIKGKK